LVWLALNSLERTPLRIALTAFGVAIATGALVSMVGFALGLQARAEEPFQKLELLNRIDVTRRRPASKMPAGGADGPPSGPVLDDDAVARLVAIPGVALAYPELHVDNVHIAGAPTPQTAPASGLPAEATRLRFVNEALIAGRYLQAGRKEVVLGDQLAKDLGFPSAADAVGRPLSLQVRGLNPANDGSFRIEQKRLEVEVAGVWQPVGGRDGFSSRELVMPLDLVKGLPGANTPSLLHQLVGGKNPPDIGFRRVVVRVGRPGDLFPVEKQIQDMGFHAETLLGRLKEMRTVFLLMDLVLTAVGAVALVVAGLGIINTLLMSVLERFREIGILKALGASDGDVRILFLAEAALVGLLGGTGGLVLGRAVSWVIEAIVNAMARSKGLDDVVVEFAFPGRLLGGAVLFALLVSLASGVYPASRAARVDPARALRGE
jgi:putative ABC transport system permease protein